MDKDKTNEKIDLIVQNCVDLSASATPAAIPQDTAKVNVPQSAVSPGEPNNQRAKCDVLIARIYILATAAIFVTPILTAALGLYEATIVLLAFAYLALLVSIFVAIPSFFRLRLSPNAPLSVIWLFALAFEMMLLGIVSKETFKPVFAVGTAIAVFTPWAFLLVTLLKAWRSLTKSPQPTDTSPERETSSSYAPVSKRLVACLIDAVIVGLIGALFAAVWFPIGAACVGIEHHIDLGRTLRTLFTSGLPMWLQNATFTGALSAMNGLVGAIVLPIGILFLLGIGELSAPGWQGTAGVLIVCSNAWLAFAYYALTESSSHRATIGKRIMGLQVTSLDGGRLSLARAAMRFVARIFSVGTFMLGYLLPFAMPNRQALHDVISGCIVVTNEPQPDGPSSQKR